MKANNGETPTVSVVMCTYNGERFLREQIDSILAQDYPPYEIVVQDDGSTDATPAILRTYAAQHPQLFRLYFNEERLGFNRNFHSALLRATGDFIAISDQDDIWLPQKLRRQVETIGERNLCFSDAYALWDEGQATQTRTDYSSYLENWLLFAACAGHTMLLRTDFLRSMDYWEEGVVYDYWIAVNAQLGRGVVKTSEPLVYHRKYLGSVSTVVGKKQSWQPYVKGYASRRKQQRKSNYQRFYAYFAEHASAEQAPVAKQMARLMLKRSPLALLQLCYLCGKHYKRVYRGQPHGLKGRIHGFFAPLIAPYAVDNFQLEK